jgi:hypothetical protein
MRGQLENVVGQKSGDFQTEGERGQGQQDVADQTRVLSIIETVHAFIAPGADFFGNQKTVCTGRGGSPDSFPIWNPSYC